MTRLNLTGRKKMVAIVGPTASGKSDLAIKIAEKIGGEIISADSRQVYRGMDIGTGKIKRDKGQGPRDKEFYSEKIRHFLIDVASPKKIFTANDFVKLGGKAIAKIISEGKIPVIVGGTGFYIDALLGRVELAGVPPNKKLRAKLDKLNPEKLYAKLAKLNPERAKIIDRHNKRRLIRAIEIALGSKKLNLKSKNKIQNPILSLRTIWIGIYPGKEKLAENIIKRLNTRLRQGMIDEVRRLHEQGVSWKRLDDFGLEYRQISRYLRETRDKRPSFAKASAGRQETSFKKSEYYQKLLAEIIKYSKRQMTWFKSNKDIKWQKSSKVKLGF